MTPGPIDELNDALQEAEDAIYDLNLGVSASVRMDETGCLLIWRKEASDWQLMIQPNGAKAPTILAKASKRHRVLAANKLRDLVTALRIEHEKNDADVKAAIVTVRRLVSELHSEVAADMRDASDIATGMRHEGEADHD